MTLGHHLSSLLGSLCPLPSLSVYTSMSASVSVSFLVLARWEEGAQCSGSRCQLTQAAGSEVEKVTEPGAPGHTATLQDTYSGSSQERSVIHGEMGPRGHTHRYTIQHTAAPHNTRMPNTEGHIQRNHTHTLTNTHLGTPGYTVTGTRGILPEENPGPWARTRTQPYTHPKEHTDTQAQR